MENLHICMDVNQEEDSDLESDSLSSRSITPSNSEYNSISVQKFLLLNNYKILSSKYPEVEIPNLSLIKTEIEMQEQINKYEDLSKKLQDNSNRRFVQNLRDMISNMLNLPPDARDIVDRGDFDRLIEIQCSLSMNCMISGLDSFK